MANNTNQSTGGDSSDAKPRIPDYRDFEDARDRIRKLVSVMDDLAYTAKNNRELRYTLIDVEAERKSNKIGPDELYIPQHIIDSNIRREQARYVAFISTSRRAAVFEDIEEPGISCDVIEKDFTGRVRYDDWQFNWYRLIDGMQQNAYGVFELVFDATAPGNLRLQEVAYDDLGYSLDSKDFQSCEMLTRRYYFTKTQLLSLADDKLWKFDKEQVDKCVTTKDTGDTNDYKQQSLYKVEKVMFRVKGVVYVGWSCEQKCDDWLREPRPLYLGRQTMDPLTGQWVKAFETRYPYYLAQYNISENTTIRDLKGRAYMDQDTQEAVTSLISSYVTAHRRAAGLYFSREETDPNSDTVTQSNITFKTGCLINAKVKQFQLVPPDSSMLSAVQGLASMNMQENSQINYAANNREDSRKTATEIQAAQAESQLLSTIQLALFSAFARSVLNGFYEIFITRVRAGLIKVTQDLMELYQRDYRVKPAGDSDVIERQEKIVKMQQAWPVVQNMPFAPLFVAKLLQLMFPDDAMQYIAMMQQDRNKDMAIQSLGHVLQGLIADPRQLSPQAQQHIPAIAGLLQQVGMMQQQQQGPQQQQRGQQRPPQPQQPAQIPQQVAA